MPSQWAFRFGCHPRVPPSCFVDQDFKENGFSTNENQKGIIAVSNAGVDGTAFGE